MPDDGEAAPAGGGEKKKKLLADWKGLKGWQKAGVLIAGGGLVIAILMYMNSQKTPASTGGDALSGALMGNASPTMGPGNGEYYPSVPTPTNSTPQATIVAQGTASPPAFTNIASGSAGSGLLGGDLGVFRQGGKLWGVQPGGQAVDLSSVLPTGSKVYAGNQGRYWYETAGSNQQQLLTSGTGSTVNKGIGATVKPPKGAWTV